MGLCRAPADVDHFGELMRDRELRVWEKRASHSAGSDGYSHWNWMYQEIELMGATKESYRTRTRVHYVEVLERSSLSQDEINASRYPIPFSFT